MIRPEAVVSPMRAAGMPPMKTVAEPLAIISGGGTTQPGGGVTMSNARAAGKPPISTVVHPGGRIGNGGPTGGTDVCKSVIRAAGGISKLVTDQLIFTMLPFRVAMAPPESSALAAAFRVRLPLVWMVIPEVVNSILFPFSSSSFSMRP